MTHFGGPQRVKTGSRVVQSQTDGFVSSVWASGAARNATRLTRYGSAPYKISMNRRISSFVGGMLARLHRLKDDESGQDLVEYALILAMIAFSAVMGIQDMANGLNTSFNKVRQLLDAYISHML